MNFDSNILKEIYKIITKAPYILLGISLGSGLLLFLPDKIISKMYLLDFRNKSGFIIGLILLFSSTMLITIMLVKLYKKYSIRYMNKKIGEGMKKYLEELEDKQEIKIIKQILNEEDYTMELPKHSGITIKLQEKGIITQAGTVYYDINNPVIPYFLQPYIISCIEKDEKLKKKFNYKR